MSENKKSKFIPILLVLIIVAIAGWYVGAKTLSLKNQNSASLNQNTNGSEQKWEAYVNEKYKYQFEYPANNIKLLPDSTDGAIAFWGSDQSDFLSVAVVNDITSLDAWLKENPDKIIIQKTKIAGYDGYITRQDSSSYDDRMAIFIKDDQLFTIGTRLPSADFERILGSFKFEN